VNMKEARNMAAKFPTVFVQNRADAPAKITAEMSLGCPDIYENDSRSLKLDAYGTYSKQISRNMFENIKADSIYIKVKSTQEIFFQMRLTEEQPGTLCTSAIPFNWTAGNDVAANSNQWVSVDLHDILKDPLKPSVRVTILNKDKKACSGTAWLAFACESNVSPDMQNVNFSLASNGTKSKRLPYSLIETANDSIVWVRVVANTTVHVSAELVYPSTPFEPIDCPIIESADTLDWNTVYTREAGTRWYLLPKRVLESLATLTTTPEIHVTDKSGNTNKITAEFAYVCPIESEMMKESRTLNANQTLTKLIERATIDQVIRKEQVYIRVTAQGAYEFQAKLINPNTGNDRNHAINLCLDSTYIQHGNTVMWYKLDTRAWKSNPDLYGKRLNIKAKNSDNKTEFQVWLYEDVSEENLIEKWLGNADEGKRKSPANEVRSRSIPASVIYGMSDTEFYFRVEMNHAMKFSLKLDDYETLPEPVNVKEVAKLAVPNVTYTIPANQDNWYVVCAPYMYNNYSLTDSTSIELTNKGTAPAHVRVIGTMQDVMTFKMPERSRTIEAGAHYIKSYKQLLNKAIKKAGFGYDIAQTSSSFIEEQVRKYTASPEDSLTGYFRICSDQPLEVRIFNVTPTTGQECVKAPMKFDWEHGNVNPAGQETYYLVNLESWRVPEHSAIRLHVENWSENENEATAELRYNCTDPLPIVDPIDYKLKGNQDKWKDINREVIGSIAGWSNIVIRYYSEETSRIWVEVVPEQPRDTVYGDTIILACVGDTIYDTFVTPNIPHFVDKAYNPDTLIWRDTVEFLNDTALAMWDSIFTYKVITRLNPEVIKVPGAQRPYVKRGEEIKFSDTSDWLIGQYRTARNDNDTIKDVDSILWEWSTGGGLFTPLQLGQKTSKEAVKLTYQIRTLCNDTLPGDTISYIARDTLDVEACEEYVWDAKPGSYYTASVLDSVEYLAMDSVAYLNLTINMPTYGDTTDVEACGSFIWYGVEYTVSSNPGEPYTHKLEKANIHGCDSIIRMNLTITAQKTNEVWETACESYDWNGKTYTQTGIYKDTLPAASGCDSIVTLNLTINHVTYGDTTDVEACGSFIWYGVEYTESSKPGEPYTHTLEKGNIHECDSIIRMNLTIYQPTYGDTTDVEACGSFTWYGVEYKQSSKPGEPYTHTLEKANIHGCDSIIRMNLTIKQPSSGEEWVTACESYEWHDVTYTQGGDYEAQLTNVAGCDSIATLHLTINLPVRKSISESACKSYDWAGKTYTETGTYEHNFEGEAANGCDSIVTLNLTIFSDYELGDTTFMTQCKSYTWDVNGKTYTKSGLYKDTTDSKTGMYCGTVRFLQLTINQPKEVEIEETSCGTYEWHGETFKPAATPYDTVVTYRTELESGCDSITILTLHMLPLIEPTVINEEACVSYTWDVTKETYLRDTIVSHTFQAGYCDSVVTLYLTIKQPIVGDTVADECNLFVWRDVTYITDTIVFDTIAGAASNGCDSIVRLSLKIGKPFVGELDLIDQYNGRLLMINRTQINKLLADSLDRDNDTTLVKWYRESSPEDEFLGVGYYYTNLDGSPIEAGVYYAVVEIPASNGAKCGAKGETQHYRLSGGKSAPALIPTLARPGQDVRVINLDPELYTTIRIYSTEGVLQNTYNVHGENTFTIKAANNHGFYLVELSGDSMNTTLRYIVK